MQEFELKPEHLKLLKAMEPEWNGCDFGAPGFEPKRPFGNTSSVYPDIANILGVTPKDPEGFTNDERRELRNIYEGTQYALQILVSNAETGVKPGKYVSNDGKTWYVKGQEPKS